MAKRISRAKQQLRGAGVRFDLPPAAEWAGRLQVVLHVLYLVFSEGYTSTSGPDLQRADLTTEAIRLARLLHQLVPADGEVVGLLALMLLTDARRVARTTADGSLVPLAEQRRDRWDTARIQEGVALLTRALGTVPVGPYQLQAAIAAVHDQAPSEAETDWPQILALYQALELVAPGPAVTLNRAIAVAMVNGPRAGLAVLGTLDAARHAYQRAARMTTNLPEQLPDPARRPAELTRQPAAQRRLVSRASSHTRSRRPRHTVTTPTGIAVPGNACRATRSDSVSIVTSTSAEVGRSTAPERVRRRATGARPAPRTRSGRSPRSPSPGTDPAHRIVDQLVSEGVRMLFHVGMRWIHRPRQMSAAAAR